MVGLFVMSLVIFALRARREQAALAKRFGDDWKSYAARTKSLIPFIY